MKDNSKRLLMFILVLLIFLLHVLVNNKIINKMIYYSFCTILMLQIFLFLMLYFASIRKKYQIVYTNIEALNVVLFVTTVILYSLLFFLF